MKKLYFVLLGLLLTSCTSHTLDRIMELSDGPRLIRPEFKSTADLCDKSAGKFNDKTNLCICIMPMPFVANESNMCHVNSATADQSRSYVTQDKKQQLDVINEAGLSKDDLEKFVRETSIPANAKSRVFIFKNKKQYSAKNAVNNLHFLNTNFLKSESSAETQIYFAPVATPDLRYAGDGLSGDLMMILTKPLDNFKIIEIKMIDKTSCINGCYQMSLIADTKDYLFARMQTFYGGNRLFDTIRVVNKFDNHLEVVLVLFNGKLSHYYKATGSGYFSVYTNAGEKLNSSATIKEDY